MITAPYMAYRGATMKYEYLVAVEHEPKTGGVDSPIDFGDISAPDVLAAGSVYSREYKPGRCFALTRCVQRPA